MNEATAQSLLPQIWPTADLCDVFPRSLGGWGRADHNFDVHRYRTRVDARQYRQASIIVDEEKPSKDRHAFR